MASAEIFLHIRGSTSYEFGLIHANFVQPFCNMTSNKSISHRVGSLYCLYCLYETQPFKPPYKIYLSLGGLQGLRALVTVANEMGIRAVSAIIKRMLEKDVFLFGYVDINDYSDKERIKELVNVQNACIKKMQEKLLTGTDMEPYLHMDLGMELDLEVLTKISAEYARSKSLAIQEAGNVVDVENIRHLGDERPTIGYEVEKINEEWDNQKEVFSQLTASSEQHRRGESEQLMLLPATQQNLGDDEQQPESFMKLLMGEKSPRANGDDDMEEDDFDYAKDLETQLFEDL
ncbi:hypothetical protein RND81_08G201900 [Saponaria officinalis]|uniref:Uncharacterized protein n=1 Tax=Saponaria officinalis TaxID=3572 RepID=A0AAW1JAY1_SAPOF